MRPPVLLAVVLAASPFFGQAVADPFPTSHSFLFSEPTAVRLEVFLPHDAPGLAVSVTPHWRGLDREQASLVYLHHRESGLRLAFGTPSSQAWGPRVEASLAGVRLNERIETPGGCPCGDGIGLAPAAAGHYTVVVVVAATNAMDWEFVNLSLPGSAIAHWTFAPAHTLTASDFVGTHAGARVFSVGGSVHASTTAQANATSEFWGFSTYVPGSVYDHHDLRVTHANLTQSAHERFYLSADPGAYVFRLDQTSIGDPPGRVAIAYADFPKAWA